MNILIYGFGRMGLTHYTILNSLLSNANFTFVETNKKLIFIVKKNIHAKFLTDDKSLKNPFDFTLITTPPIFHNEIVKSSLKRNDKFIFVEKPFGGYSNITNHISSNNIFIGYVLRHNPIINWVKTNIDLKKIVEVNASYLSNTLEKKPLGWRNSHHSGVLNEMGSHVIDLANYLFDLKCFNVEKAKILSHISDVDDEVRATITSNNRVFNFYFNWVDKNIRKPVFEFILKNSDGDTIIFDQQKLTIINCRNEKQEISVADLCQPVSYYLRGVEFTYQMNDLIKNRNNICDLNDAYLVNKIMSEIINK